MKTSALENVSTKPLSATVIIPVYNAARTLRACLESVFGNQGASFEVIVVDDKSPDESKQIAMEFPCRILSLESNIMSANCRNLAVRHAQNEILIFFDADQLMEPDTIRRFLDVLEEDETIDAVVASYQYDTPMEGFFSKIKNLRHHHVHQTAEEEGASLHSGLMAIRKSVFDAHGGFEPAYQPASIEDIALGVKMASNGHRIVFRGDIQATHLKGYTLKELVLSDILHRAIPWTGLIIRDRMWRNDLNTSGSNVTSVFLSWLIPLGPFVHWVYGSLFSLVCAVLIWILNAGLLRKAFRHFGFVFFLKNLLFLPFMYFYQGIGLIAGCISYLVRGRLPGSGVHPEPNYTVIEGAQTDRPRG